MINNLKALVVVLALAMLVFWLGKPVALRFMNEADYARRRNIWLGLTAAAFVSPSFWLYLIVAAPTMVWAGSRDRNPMALTLLLLHVIPPISIELPTVAINRLFDLNNYRLLALFVLLPAVLRFRGGRPQRKQENPFLLADLCVAAYCVLQLLLLLPYESLTNTMRRTFLFGLDVGLVYYAFSRFSANRRQVVEAAACFMLPMAVMSLVAVFETSRHWLLYTGINEQWGDPNIFAWLMRGEELRAQASAGHALALGYLCAMALGLWLFLQRSIDDPWRRLGGAAIVMAGAFAAISRGPWLVAALAYFSYYLLSPTTKKEVVKRFSVLAIVATVALLSPYGASIVDHLPFVGTLDAGNVTYRQQLAEMSWQLIQQNPFFGSPFVLTQMESLRQGQGIIDLVNTYASIALFYGCVGLALFLGAFLTGQVRCILMARRLAASDKEGAALAASISACMLGTLLMLAVGSFGTGLAVMYWVLSGMAVGVAGQSTQEELAPPVAHRHRQARVTPSRVRSPT